MTLSLSKQLENLLASENNCSTCSSPCIKYIENKLEDITHCHPFSNDIKELYYQYLSYVKVNKSNKLLTNLNSELKTFLSSTVNTLSNLTKEYGSSSSSSSNDKKSKSVKGQKKRSCIALIGDELIGKTTLLAQLYSQGSCCKECVKRLDHEQEQQQEEKKDKLTIHAAYFMTPKYNNIKLCLLSLSQQLNNNIPSLSIPLLNQKKEKKEEKEELLKYLNKSSLDKILTELIVNPINQLSSAVVENIGVISIILDGLDLMNSIEEKEELMKVIKSNIQNIPLYLNFIFSINLKHKLTSIKINKNNFTSSLSVERSVNEKEINESFKKFGIQVVHLINTDKRNIKFIKEVVNRKINGRERINKNNKNKRKKRRGGRLNLLKDIKQKVNNNEVNLISERSSYLLGKLKYLNLLVNYNPQSADRITTQVINNSSILSMKKLREYPLYLSTTKDNREKDIIFKLNEYNIDINIFSIYILPLFITKFYLYFDISLYIQYLLLTTTENESKQEEVMKLFSIIIINILQPYIEVKYLNNKIETLSFTSQQNKRELLSIFFKYFGKNNEENDQQQKTLESMLSKYKVREQLSHLMVKQLSNSVIDKKEENVKEKEKEIERGRYSFSRMNCLNILSQLKRYSDIEKVLLTSYTLLNTYNILEQIQTNYLSHQQRELSTFKERENIDLLYQSLVHGFTNNDRNIKNNILGRLPSQYHNILPPTKQKKTKEKECELVPLTNSLKSSSLPIDLSIKLDNILLTKYNNLGTLLKTSKDNNNELLYLLFSNKFIILNINKYKEKYLFNNAKISLKDIVLVEQDVNDEEEKNGDEEEDIEFIDYFNNNKYISLLSTSTLNRIILFKRQNIEDNYYFIKIKYTQNKDKREKDKRKKKSVDDELKVNYKSKICHLLLNKNILIFISSSLNNNKLFIYNYNKYKKYIYFIKYKTILNKQQQEEEEEEERVEISEFKLFSKIIKSNINKETEEKIVTRRVRTCNKIFFSTNRGDIYVINVDDDDKKEKEKEKVIDIKFKLLLHISINEKVHAILSFIPYSLSTYPNSLYFIVYSTSGLIAKYSVNKSKSTTTEGDIFSKLEYIVKKSSSRHNKNTLNNVDNAIGVNNVINKKGLKMNVFNLERGDDEVRNEYVRYELPCSSYYSYIKETDILLNTFLNYSVENNKIELWNINKLKSNIEREVNRVTRTATKAHLLASGKMKSKELKKGGGSSRGPNSTITGNSSTTGDEDEDEDESVDDFDFFLNVDNDIQATNQMIDISNIQPQPLNPTAQQVLQQTTTNTDEEQDDEEDESDEEDDEDFFLNTTSFALQDITTSLDKGKENSKTKEQRKEKKRSESKQNSLSVSVISSKSGSLKHRKRNNILRRNRSKGQFTYMTANNTAIGYEDENKLAFTKLSLNNMFSKFWYNEWISCLEINEAKGCLCVGYKDGKFILYSLTSSFFELRRKTFGNLGLEEIEEGGRNGSIVKVCERQLDSEIRSIKISETGLYLVCNTKISSRIYTLSRTGYKTGQKFKDQIDHLSLIWSQKRNSPLQNLIHFSDCSRYIKLSALDEVSIPSIIIDLESRRRLYVGTGNEGDMAKDKMIKWEKQSLLKEAEIKNNDTVFDKKTGDEFRLEGRENIMSLVSDYHNIIVVAQGGYLHFLKRV